MKILILGFSKSGKSAFNLLKDKHDCYIYDKKKVNVKNYYSYIRLKKELPYFDIVIRSPGIKITSKVYQLAIHLSKKVISEIELGLSYLKDNFIIGVTGSNGKTTLVNMIEHLLKDNYKVFKLGNIGNPLTSKIKEIKKEDIIILELSSFQLENTFSKVFSIGVITNISNNHLDSVFSKYSYIASKLKLIDLSKMMYVDESTAYYQKRLKKYKKIELLKQFTNDNLNKYNQTYWNIACDIALSLNIDKEEIENKKNFFINDHYRMEKVKEYNNLIFINDSKSTSLSSTNACLDVYKDKNRIIILGGITKKESFKNLNKYQDDIVICYGKDGYKIFNEVGDIYFPILEEIIKYIYQHYQKEDRYIIFSPGCASFDQYDSYVERGHHFNLLINSMQTS